MSPPSVSVVIVSHSRPSDLKDCIASLAHQTYENFEVVVVADYQPDIFPESYKFAELSEQNISRARNIGISLAAGEIIAFCDDDARPDPVWLERMVVPFQLENIASAAGFSRGRNGFSLQWHGYRFDRRGADLPLTPEPSPPYTVYPADPETPVKLIGTNMAIRRAALEQVGGFDESYRFYHEETDLKLRLDLAGYSCAIVPEAQIHHVFAASPRRRADRVPTDLSEIAASAAYFINRYSSDFAADVERFRNLRKTWLSRLIRRKAITKEEFAKLSHDLDTGIEAGKARQQQLATLDAAPQPFLPFSPRFTPHVVVVARYSQIKWARALARSLEKNGVSVSVIHIRASYKSFRARFDTGIWMFAGGVWGKIDRNKSRPILTNSQKRLSEILQHVNNIHPVNLVVSKKPGDFSSKNGKFLPLNGLKVDLVRANDTVMS